MGEEMSIEVDKELMDLIDTWASGGFHDSYAAYEAFKELSDKRHKMTTEACATAVCIKLDEQSYTLGSTMAQAGLDV